MELIDNLLLGLQVAAEPTTLAYCFFGVLLLSLIHI